MIITHQNCLRLDEHDAHMYPRRAPKHYCLGKEYCIWTSTPPVWENRICDNIREPHAAHKWEIESPKGPHYLAQTFQCVGWEFVRNHYFAVSMFSRQDIDVRTPGIEHLRTPLPPGRYILPGVDPDSLVGKDFRIDLNPGRIMEMPPPNPDEQPMTRKDARMLASVIREEARTSRGRAQRLSDEQQVHLEKVLRKEFKKLARRLMTPTIVETEMEN